MAKNKYFHTHPVKNANSVGVKLVLYNNGRNLYEDVNVGQGVAFSRDFYHLVMKFLPQLHNCFYRDFRSYRSRLISCKQMSMINLGHGTTVADSTCFVKLYDNLDNIEMSFTIKPGYMLVVYDEVFKNITYRRYETMKL